MEVFTVLGRNTLGREGTMLAVMLSGCLVAEQAWSATGPELATALNKAYQQTAVTSCGQNQLAILWCSGVLARAVPQAGGSVESDAAFLRRDTVQNISQPLSAAALAFVLPLAPQPSAMTAWCALAEGPGANAGGSAHRCWPAGHNAHAQDTDPSSCAALLPSGHVTLATWQSWRHNGQQSRLCSFSTRSQPEFATALQASAALKQVPGIIMPTWLTSDVGKLATKALIYPEGNVQALAQARKTRDAWSASTGPLSILAFKPVSGFSYNEKDNVKSPVDNTDVALRRKLGEKLKTGLMMSLIIPAKRAELPHLPDDFPSPFVHSVLKYNSINSTTDVVETDADKVDKIHAAFRDGTYGVLGELSSHSVPDAVFYVTRGSGHHINLLREITHVLQQWYLSKNIKVPLVRVVSTLPDSTTKPEDFFIPDDGKVIANPDETVVAELNRRLNHTVGDCGTDSRGQLVPAYICSGLIVRTTAPSPASFALTLSPQAITHGAASFSFIRRDTNTTKLWNNPQGVILKPNVALTNRAKCIYPMDANTWGSYAWRDVAHNQCSNAQFATSANDFSSCQKTLNLQASATTTAWTTAFKNRYSYNGDGMARQCSFSIHDAHQFAAAIQISSGDSTHPGVYQWNELVLAPWPGECNGPEIEAFWYFDDRSRTAALSYKKEYAEKCNRQVPAVKLYLGVAPHVELEDK